MKKFFENLLDFAVCVIFITAYVYLFSFLPSKDASKQENRTLAQRPKLYTASGLNHNFGKNIENWLKDQFPFRDKIIKAQFEVMYKINGRIDNNKAFIGDDGWMFKKNGIFSSSSSSNKKNQDKALKNAKILKDLHQYLEGKNIPIYLILLPDRNEILKKYWKNYYKVGTNTDQHSFLIDSLKDLPNIKIVYPKQKLIEATNKLDVYLKEDSHLSEEGINIFLMDILQKIKLDFPEITISPEIKKTKKVYEKGRRDIAAELGLDARGRREFIHLQYKFKDIFYRDKEKISKKRSLKHKWEVENPIILRSAESTNPILDRKIISFGVCHTENVFTFLAPLAKHSVWVRTNVSHIGVDAVEYSKEKIRENLINIEKDSAVLILLTEDYSMIAEALKGLE